MLLGLLTAVAFLVAEHRLQGEQASGVARLAAYQHVGSPRTRD